MPAIRVRFRAVPAMVIAAIFLFVDASPAAGKEPFGMGRLWRISKAGVADSFVLGTIHVADPRVAAIAKPVENALARSRILAVELVPEAGDARTFELEELEDGKRLEPLIGVETFSRLRGELTAQNLPAPVIERLKPWAAMLKIARNAPKAEQKSLDEQLFVAARIRRLQVLPLELLEEQVAAFDTVPLDTQVALLRHALDHRDALAANVEPTIAAWLRGDLAGLARISDRAYEQFPGMRAHYGRLMQHIIVDRTALLHHRLFMPLKSGRVFVAIGALHLYGDKGLLALLKEDGYRVTKVW
jgi:uncharacterized protein YbaP (TraB family)